MSILLEASRTGYATNQIKNTMTVQELIDFLANEFDTDDEIYISNDNGYTYGGINEHDFRENEE